MSRRKHPDAALLRCCAKMEAAQAKMDAMQQEAERDRSTITPERDKRFDALLSRWHAAFDAAAPLAALTPEGIRAKATMLRIDRSVHDDDTPFGRLLDSLLADLLPPAEVAASAPSPSGLAAQGQIIAGSIIATAAQWAPESRSAVIGAITAEAIRHLVLEAPGCALPIAARTMLAREECKC